MHELLNEVPLVVQARTGHHRPADLHWDLLVLTVARLLAVLLHQHEDVVDSHLNLLDQLNLEDEIVVDDLLLHVGPPPHLGVEVHVHAAVVLELGLTDDVVVSEVVKARQDVAQPQDLPELPDELLLLGLRGNHLPRLEPGPQFANLLQILLQVLLVRLEEHQPAGGLVAEQGDGLIGVLLQVPEADHVAVGLDRVEDPVRARERLDESVRAQ